MTQKNSGGSGDSGDSGAKSGYSDEDNGSKPVDARVARRRQDALGRRLRQMYDDVVGEPVPEEFMSFLKTADGRTSKTDKSGA